MFSHELRLTIKQVICIYVCVYDKQSQRYIVYSQSISAYISCPCALFTLQQYDQRVRKQFEPLPPRCSHAVAVVGVANAIVFFRVAKSAPVVSADFSLQESTL